MLVPAEGSSVSARIGMLVPAEGSGFSTGTSVTSALSSNEILICEDFRVEQIYAALSEGTNSIAHCSHLIICREGQIIGHSQSDKLSLPISLEQLTVAVTLIYNWHVKLNFKEINVTNLYNNKQANVCRK